MVSTTLICVEIVIAGHLFVNDLKKNAPFSAPLMFSLMATFMLLKQKLKVQSIKKKSPTSSVQSRANLCWSRTKICLRIFTKIHETALWNKAGISECGEKQWYRTPYKEDRTLEMTRMTLSAGLFAQTNLNMAPHQTLNKKFILS